MLRFTIVLYGSFCVLMMFLGCEEERGVADSFFDHLIKIESLFDALSTNEPSYYCVILPFMLYYL